MNIIKTLDSQKLVESLKNGKVGVLPTDTIYGLSGDALNEKAVARIYEIKGRSYTKPLIVFIASEKDLELFDVKIDKKTQAILRKVWPGMVSVILPASNKRFEYLHRGTKTIAFRYIMGRDLSDFVKKTGPIVSTSANREGLPFATTIEEAKKYFGEKVDFYVDGGKLKALPSTIISIGNKGEIKILRQGAVKINERG